MRKPRIIVRPIGIGWSASCMPENGIWWWRPTLIEAMKVAYEQYRLTYCPY